MRLLSHFRKSGMAFLLILPIAVSTVTGAESDNDIDVSVYRRLVGEWIILKGGKPRMPEHMRNYTIEELNGRFWGYNHVHKNDKTYHFEVVLTLDESSPSKDDYTIRLINRRRVNWTVVSKTSLAADSDPSEPASLMESVSYPGYTFVRTLEPPKPKPEPQPVTVTVTSSTNPRDFPTTLHITGVDENGDGWLERSFDGDVRVVDELSDFRILDGRFVFMNQFSSGSVKIAIPKSDGTSPFDVAKDLTLNVRHPLVKVDPGKDGRQTNLRADATDASIAYGYEYIHISGGKEAHVGYEPHVPRNALFIKDATGAAAHHEYLKNNKK